MELLKQELYKIFSKKTVYITLLFFSLIAVFLTSSRGMQMVYGNMHDFYKEYYQQYEGPVTAEKVKLAEDGIRQIDEYLDEYAEQHNGYGSPTAAMNRKGLMFNDILEADQRARIHDARINALEQRLKIMENKGQHDFEYKKAKLYYSMVKNIKTPGIYFNWGWRETSDFINIFGTVIIGVMILLGVSTVFSDEYSTNMDALILSSKNGKRGVITAKLLAAGVYIMIVALFFTLLNLLIQFKIMGFAGGSSTLQELFRYENSPYAWTVAQYVPRQIAVHLYGSLAFGLIALLISSLCKSGLGSFFISGTIFGLPLFINSILYIKSGWAAKINEFSYAVLMRGLPLFNQFKAYNIFGHPVLYLNLMLTLFTLISIAVICLTYRSFRNHQVS
jgi:hypothetical protein